MTLLRRTAKKLYQRFWLPFSAATEDRSRRVGALAFRKGVDFTRWVHLLPAIDRNSSENSGILVIHLASHFGDAVMFTPLLQALHDEWPDAPLDVACGKGVETFYAALPYVRTVYAAPVDSTPPLLPSAIFRHICLLTRWYWTELRALKPRVCLTPRWGDDLFGSIYLSYLIGAPERIGFSSTVDARQRVASERDHMLTRAVTGANGLHEPQRLLYAGQQSGLLPTGKTYRTDVIQGSLHAIAATVHWSAVRTRLGLPTAAYAVVAPGASSANKRWPTEQWSLLTHRLLQHGLHVVLLSGKGDRETAEAVASAVPHPDVHLVAGKTSLAESIALIANAALFVGNDSGPGHAAGALGVPTVILFVSAPDVYPDHPLAAARIHPMGPFVATLLPTLQMPCSNACMQPFAHCINTISDEAVMQSAKHIMQCKAAATNQRAVALESVV